MSLLQPYLNKGHTVYLNNWFFNFILFLLLIEKGANACGTVQKRWKDMPITDKLKKGEIVFYSPKKLLSLK